MGNTRARRARRIVVPLAGAVLALAGSAATAPSPARAAAPVVVSVTLDDGHTSHTAAGQMLASYGMKGTFYVNSGKVGTSSYYLRWDEIGALAAAGHEIGGHTLDHARLSRLSAAEAQRQVCDDRRALRDRGLPAASFAYPYGDVNASLEGIVRTCGYTSGRALGGVKSGTVCRSCPYAETIPPRDPYAVRTLRHLTPTTTLSELQGYVTNAEKDGGWVVLVFHGVCDDRCTGTYSYSATSFAQFLQWMQQRGTVVKTVAEVIG